MPQKITRIGVLGCAKIARRSMIPAILQLRDDFKLVAVASRENSKAAEFANEFGCEAVTGYEQLIARDDIDAIYLPLPTGMHGEWIARAIAAGKHVYAEKSFASDLGEARSMVAAAAERGVALMEGYMFLYHRQQALATQLLRDGVIGELRHFHGAFGFPPLAATDFRYDEALGGGVLADAAGYPLRAAQLFCGDGLTVQGASVYRDRSRGNSLWGSAFLSDGQGLGASIAFGFDNVYQCRYEIWGSRGKLIAERAYTPSPTFSPRLVLETADGNRVFDIDPDNHFIGAMKEFRSILLNPDRRAVHHQHILLQSQALERIRVLSSPCLSER